MCSSDLDEEAVEQAVTAGPAYVGLVGSRKRGAAVLGYLADRGVAREALDRVRVPAGLDLGKTSHPEIAVAILAELVQLRSAGQLGERPASRPAAAAPYRVDPGINPGKAESIPGSTRDPVGAAGTMAPAGAAEAVDPVCEMTVAAGKAGRPLEYGGVTYYFCSAGCRAEFESDPESYARKETRC